MVQRTLLIAVLSLSVAICDAYAEEFKVVRVYDGDTLKAVAQDIEIEVRLFGIDAPETSTGADGPGQPFSLKSAAYLAELVLNLQVKIVFRGRDQKGRHLATVYANGRNVNLEMVASGLAEAYFELPVTDTDKAPYLEAERNAQAAARGIWILRDQYFSPKDWREIYQPEQNRDDK
jgi:micrococcal nuclease